jgi:hypothetical protein
MAGNIGSLLDSLVVDPWRAEVGFSEEVARANDRLFDAPEGEASRGVIRDWIGQHQPCLFGRMAARADLIEFCLLSEADLRGDRAALRDKIQGAREEWLALGHDGKKSAFVIVAISPLLAHAVPDATVQTIAQELCAAYLLQAIEPDEIYLDEMFLEKPGTKRTTWKWLAGVNYFCAQGDKRWWHDHRIPGGMAFSVNSVGHLVKSGQLSEALKHLDESLGGPPESQENEAVTSLGKALDLAMRTIGLAANAVSGKATMLIPLPDPIPSNLPPSPIALPKLLQGKNHATYKGWYHTDVTVPSDYFRADVERPADVVAKELDFTYLYHDDVDNPDHMTTAKGRRVRSDADVEQNPRLLRMVAESVVVKDQPLLQKAMARRKRS